MKRRLLFIVCGVCWIGIGLITAFISLPYLRDGAVEEGGVFSRILGFASSGNIGLGLVHEIGCIALILFFLSVGLILLLRGFFPKDRQKPELNH
jgi:hypothetical protein